MKIALLGATGPSGVQVVQEALERGHTVTAIVRNPDKLTDQHENLKVIKADIFDADSLATHLAGHDAVLSCLGCPPSWFSMWTITFYTDSARSIVAAMRKANLTRLIFMSAWYTKYNSNDPNMINWVLKPLFLGQSLKNLGEMEDYLEAECPDIQYTSVRCPQLTNLDSTGAPVLVEEGQRVVSDKRIACCRRDAAKFMLDEATNGAYKRKCMAIGSG